MKKVATFTIQDSYHWPKRKVMREALDAAKRRGEFEFFVARCVCLVDYDFRVYDKSLWTFDVYGHDVEVPDSMKHWTEKLDKHIDSLTIGEGWAE